MLLKLFLKSGIRRSGVLPGFYLLTRRTLLAKIEFRLPLLSRNKKTLRQASAAVNSYPATY